ncbi:hypothetical protein ACRYI5_07625 [Furfurilactobacillus sp. WILCCON 0119]
MKKQLLKMTIMGVLAVGTMGVSTMPVVASGAIPVTTTHVVSKSQAVKTTTEQTMLTTAQKQALILMNAGSAAQQLTGYSSLNVVTQQSPWAVSVPGDDNQEYVFNTPGGLSALGYTITGDTVNLYHFPSAADAGWVNTPIASFSLKAATTTVQNDANAWQTMQTLAEKF